MLRQTPLLKEMHPDERDFPFVVAKGVNKMELEFWDQKKSDWINEWTRTNELPRMIKIKLEFARRNPNQPCAQSSGEAVMDVMPLPAIMGAGASPGAESACARRRFRPPPGGITR